MKNPKEKQELSPEKREFIRKTAEMRRRVEAGEANTVNEAFIRFVYTPRGHVTLMTIKEWNKTGKRVIKGSKALYLWSAPVKGNKTLPDDEAAGKEYYKICAVFSNLQVQNK